MNRFLLLPFTTLLAIASPACQSIATNTRDDAASRRYKTFTYVAIDAVKQSSQASCGAATLSCVLRYWGDDIDESTLWTNHPPENPTGYRLPELRDIARNRGFQAIAMADLSNAETFLKDQLTKGRPVLIAAVVPEGRYFGSPIPIIESLDRRSIQSPLSGGEGEWKKHYLVVIGFDEGQFLVMDPAYGIIQTQRHDLLLFWRMANFGTLLLSA